MSKTINYDEPVDVRAAGLDQKFVNLVAKRQRTKEEIAELEAEVKLQNADILAALTECGYKTVLTPDWRVTFTSGTHNTISKERLLEQGVSVKVIAKATKTTTFETVTVTAVK